MILKVRHVFYFDTNVVILDGSRLKVNTPFDIAISVPCKQFFAEDVVYVAKADIMPPGIEKLCWSTVEPVFSATITTFPEPLSA